MSTSNCNSLAFADEVMASVQHLITDAALLKSWINDGPKVYLELGGVRTPTLKTLVSIIDSRESAAAAVVIEAGKGEIRQIAHQAQEELESIADAKIQIASGAAQAAATQAALAIDAANRAQNIAGVGPAKKDTPGLVMVGIGLSVDAEGRVSVTAGKSSALALSRSLKGILHNALHHYDLARWAITKGYRPEV